MSWLDILVVAVVVSTTLYALVLFALGRRRAAALPAGRDPFVVFLVPCLDEAIVVERTVRDLLALGDVGVIVVDDASTDGTAEIVEAIGSPRVRVLRRLLPDARRGKGEALNAGYRYLLDEAPFGRRGLADVVVGVVDADGRLPADAVARVAPYFHEARVGAVQVGVRMYNRRDSLLARLQDVEFVAFTEIFQRGRDRIETAGLGGNGQFTRLLALRSLGPEPWSHCLTEDLELGLQLHALGWRIRYCNEVAVEQQAVPQWGRLLRQRTRWFQGHLQCWVLLPIVMGSPKIRARRRLDFVVNLLLPGAALVATVGIVVGYLLSVAAALRDPAAWRHQVLDGGRALRFFVLSFGLAPVVAYAYRRAERSVGWLRALLYAHLYLLYVLVWVPAGIRAASRIVRGQGRWDKTERDLSAEDVVDLTDRRPAPAPAPVVVGADDVPARIEGVVGPGDRVPERV